MIYDDTKNRRWLWKIISKDGGLDSNNWFSGIISFDNSGNRNTLKFENRSFGSKVVSKRKESSFVSSDFALIIELQV